MANNDINVKVKATGAEEATDDISGLCDELDRLAETAIKNAGDDKAKQVFANIQKISAAIREEFEQNARDLQSTASEAFDRMGVSIGSLNSNLVAFIAKIPGIGKALAAVRTAILGPLGWILALIGTIGMAIKSWATAFHDARARVEQIKLDNLKNTMNALTEDTQRYVHLLDLAAEKRENEKQILEEQIDAEHQLNEILREREKIKAGFAGMSEQGRFDIEQNAKSDANRSDIKNARQKLESEKTNNEAKIKDLQAKIDRLQEDAEEYRSSAQISGAKAIALSRKHNGVIDNTPVIGWIAGLFKGKTQDVSLIEDNNRLASEAFGKLKSTTEEIEKLKVQLEASIKKRGTYSNAETKINEQEKLNKETLDRAREEEELRRRLAIEERAREKMVRERSEQDTEVEYERNRDAWVNSIAIKLEDAGVRIDKFKKEMEDATAEMERLEKANKDAADWTEEDRRKYERAREDRERALSMMRIAKQEKDSLNQEQRQNRWAVEDMNRQRGYEDEDFERSKKYELASWDAKVAMDTKRLEEGKYMREMAELSLKARDNLSARDIAELEMKRDRGRAMEVEARSNLHNLVREGDRDTAAFEAKMRGQGGNRLTAMGLGGDAVDFNRQTAKNTGKLVALTHEMLGKFSGGPHTGVAGRLGEVTWTMR